MVRNMDPHVINIKPDVMDTEPDVINREPDRNLMLVSNNRLKE